MSDTLSLATRLRALDDESLEAAIRRRGVRPGAIKDFFDLAEALLDPASVQQQLTHLDRFTLTTIAAAAELHASHQDTDAAAIAARIATVGGRPADAAIATGLDTAVRLLFADADVGSGGTGFTVYDSVAEQLRSWPAFGLPGLAELAAGLPESALEPVSAPDLRFIDRVASERAFAATNEIAELLVELEREPARELARGGVALPDTKRLANAMSVDLASVAQLLAIADHAGLVAREAGTWLISDAGGLWLLESSDARWRILADRWLSRLPSDIRALLGERGDSLWGPGLRRFIQWQYPAGGDWMDERIADFTDAAELLGITANEAPSGPGRMLFTDGADAAARAMATLLPSEVEHVYLQHDLSIVAPGPLTPQVDYRLRTLADAENRSLASSYRVSASSLNRAMAAGESAETVRTFLSEISLTGIPQPLEYLVAEASARFGLLRVGEIAASDALDTEAGPAKSYVRSDDATTLGTVFVDQNLSALGLSQLDEHRLVSRHPRDTVFWNLSDARYPVAAEDRGGKIVTLKRRRHARASSGIDADPVTGLIERLRLASDGRPEGEADAWLERQLDIAIRLKAALTVSVTMPNGSVVDYQLEPTSIAGGRLRARDRRSAIERTLPLASIARIAPADRL